MIINEAVKDVVVIGEHTSKKASISTDKMAKLQYLLTKGLYKDPITAVIAEWTNNGIDSVVQAGKDPVENPVIVSIGMNDRNQRVFRVEDKGTGLDDQDFENVCMNYLESTKEHDNSAIGHFGIGMKSFLSLERSATFTCRKNGKERVYLVYEGAEFVNYDLIGERETTEENGVIAELVIKDGYEQSIFESKAKQKLAYYDTVALIINNRMVTNKIYRTELFQWSDQNTSNHMHLCLKDVYYTIDWDALGIRSVDFPVALRFGLDSGITPTPSRESYITNDATKKLIIERIKEVANWFATKYNENIKTFKNFYDAFPYIDNNEFCVPISGVKEFNINPIKHYMSVKLEEPRIQGVILKSPSFYKRVKAEFFFGYISIGMVNYNGKLLTKNYWETIEYHLFSQKRPVVLVGSNFVGNVKQYIRSIHGNGTMFVKSNGMKRGLKTNSSISKIDSYKMLLGLNGIVKGKWREYISEWEAVVKSCTDHFIDLTDIESDPAYIKWLTDKRDAQALARKQGIVKGKYSGINKKKGDVTLGYAYERYNKCHFKKEAIKIETLEKNHYLTVLITVDSDEELGKKIALALKNKHVKFATVGKLEQKKIPNTKQFITLEEFVSRGSKAFARLASALLFEKTLEEYNKISRNLTHIFADCIADMANDVDTLRKYAENNKSYADDDIKAAILSIAEEKKLFDQSKWDVYTRLKANLKKFEFVTCMREPASWDTAEVKKFKLVISQMLLFRKMFHNDLPEEIDVKVVPKQLKQAV